ncbi:uncharacterized protein LOC126844017 isoform X1 [Adelges cooleyi]|uniref:uncharacterized protein LOC126844017 isoform X1 n=1 Tax=Adelges cooleyi TaxID=133065 RepID=UPI00217FCA78|nr:uncharacterized protein LOC126844017 isoform X1 [Adelges cooleyi]
MFLKFFSLLVFIIVAASCNSTKQYETTDSAAPAQISAEAEPKIFGQDQLEKSDAELEHEKKIIEDSYNDCLNWASQGLAEIRDYITLKILFLYMGGLVEDLVDIEERVESYTKAAEMKDEIRFEQFSVFLKYYCKQEYSIMTLQECAEEKKEEAAKRSLKELTT